MNILELTKDLDVIPIRGDICYFKLPLKHNTYSFNKEGVKKFNEIYQYCLEQEKKGLYRRIKWTTSSDGKDLHYNIRTGRDSFHPPMWDCFEYKSGSEIVVIDNVCFRFQLRTKEEKKFWAGHICYRKFKRICKDRFDIDLDSLAIDNGEEVAASIKYPPLQILDERILDKEIYNAHHLDLNSAYPSGISLFYPELRPPLEYLYNLRQKYPHYKDILTHITGYFRSPKLGYKFAHLSKVGMEWTGTRILELTKELKNNGYIPLAQNIDGIWYIEGKNLDEQLSSLYLIGRMEKGPYHGPDEGAELTKWKTDHKYCKLRFRSIGAYEYEEDGKYVPKLRGSTVFEKMKPKSMWEWGDLYHADLKDVYKFHPDIGYVVDVMPLKEWEEFTKARKSKYREIRGEE